MALAACLEAAGGVWTADEASTRLKVKRQTLQQWRDRGRVRALQRHDGSYSSPVVQLAAPVSDTGAPRPYEAIAQITESVGSRLATEELVALLATPQPLLRDKAGQLMTPFAALALGDTAGVLDMMRWVVTPPDVDAPDVATAAQAIATA